MVSLESHETILGEPAEIPIGGGDLAALVFQFLYAAESTRTLPSILHGLITDSAETAQQLAEVVAESSLGDSLQNGTYFATTCADIFPFDSAPPENMGAFAAAVVGDGFGEVCDLIDVAASPPQTAEPVSSDKPVLMLSGRFDPVTPPEFAARGRSAPAQRHPGGARRRPPRHMAGRRLHRQHRERLSYRPPPDPRHLLRRRAPASGVGPGPDGGGHTEWCRDHPVVGRRRVSLPRSRGVFGGMCFLFHISESLTSHLQGADLHKREQGAVGEPIEGSVSHLGDRDPPPPSLEGVAASA